MAIEKEALGTAVKRVRLARGMTQVELATAAGLSRVLSCLDILATFRRMGRWLRSGPPRLAIP